MSLIIWKNEYNTTIPEIDYQHKQLVKLINELFDALNNGKTKETLKNILDELVNYTIVHFSTEENLMSNANYDNFEQHKTEHQNFTNKVLDFNKQYDEGNARISIQLINFLKEWLTNHILLSDKKYVQVLYSKNLV